MVSSAPIAVRNTPRSDCNSSISADQHAEDCLSGVQTAVQALQGTRLLSGRRTALKLDSIFSCQFDEYRHFRLSFFEFFSASSKETIKTARHAHHDHHGLVVPSHLWRMGNSFGEIDDVALSHTEHLPPRDLSPLAPIRSEMFHRLNDERALGSHCPVEQKIATRKRRLRFVQNLLEHGLPAQTPA